MSLKVTTYLNRISAKRIFYKDNLVERKPSVGEKIFTESNIKFVTLDTGQHLGSYRQKRFQNMQHVSTELVVANISDRYKEDEFDGLCDKMIEDGWQELTDEQLAEFYDMWESLRELQEETA